MQWWWRCFSLNIKTRDKLKKRLFFIFFGFYTFSFGQEAHILFNRMNMAVYNPAFTGVHGAFISVNSRSQWSGINDAPRTNYLIYQLAQKEKVNLGFTVQNDRVFIENKTHFTADYNYKLQLTEGQFIYLGLKGGGFYNNIDVDRLERLYTTYNPALEPVKSYFTPILGLGMHYQTPNFFVGVGVPSLFNNKRFQDNSGWETTATDVAYLYFSGGTSLSLGGSFTLDPVFIYRAVPNSPNLFSGTLAVNYNDQFSIGAGHASNDNLAFFLSSKSLKGIEFGYGYEFMNRNEPTAIQGGTHEFFLRFLLNTTPSEATENLGYGKD